MKHGRGWAALAAIAVLGGGSVGFLLWREHQDQLRRREELLGSVTAALAGSDRDELRAVLELIGGGGLSRGDREVFRPVVENLVHADPFLVLADFADYAACQERVSAAWRDTGRWTRISILNTARSGRFSSDRAIAEYCDEIWGVEPMPIGID